MVHDAAVCPLHETHLLDCHDRVPIIELILSNDTLHACKLQSVRKLTVGHRLVAKSLYADTNTMDQLKVTGFDLFLRDTSSWPCEVLSQTLSLPSVEVLPLAPSAFFAKRQGFSNPIAYIPQLGVDFLPKMVSRACLHQGCHCWSLCLDACASCWQHPGNLERHTLPILWCISLLGPYSVCLHVTE